MVAAVEIICLDWAETIRWHSPSVSAKRRLLLGQTLRYRQRKASACASGRLTPKAERGSLAVGNRFYPLPIELLHS